VNKRIAFFDFDGTITTRDTLLEFIKYSHGKRGFYWGFFINSPYLFAYKLKIISNQRAKEKILSHFFKGMKIEKFQDICDAFAKEIIPGLVRPRALEEINKLKSDGTTIIVVSASPHYWISGWINQLQLQLIATQLEVEDGKLSGNISGKNCYGEEKVRRIKALYNLESFDEIIAYGDSSGDKPMLQLGTSYYKPFRH